MDVDPEYQILLVPAGTMVTVPTGERMAIDDGSVAIHSRALKLKEKSVVMSHKVFMAKFAESMEH